MDNLGFFTSKNKDINSPITCLGEEPFSRIDKRVLGEIFSSVNEYDSTNRSIDYRVIYIKNISRKRGVVVNTPVISIDHLYVNKQEVFKLQDLYRVKINIFVPRVYAKKNENHKKIFSNGQFSNQYEFISTFIADNQNPRYYGRSVFLDFLNLKTTEFYPIILERVIEAPVPFVPNFNFKLNAQYSVTME